jgi:hypothetical protein
VEAVKSRRAVLSLPRSKGNEDESPGERRRGIKPWPKSGINGSFGSDDGLGSSQQPLSSSEILVSISPRRKARIDNNTNDRLDHKREDSTKRIQPCTKAKHVQVFRSNVCLNAIISGYTE